MIYAVYGLWEQGSPFGSGEIEQLSAAFRPDDESVCVWVEPDEPGVLRLSIDVQASSYEEAIGLGRAALREAASTVSPSGAAREVVAMTEEGQAVWRPKRD